MKRREWGERWSFVWLVVITIVLVAGAFLISDTLKDKAVEEIFVAIEHFEKGSGQAQISQAEQHTEELETGLLINAKELEILARIIHGESGSNWCSDEMRNYVGSVFLNRVQSDLFPNTFEEVAFQTGQYSCTRKGSGYWETPTERDYETATFLITNGSQLDSDYLFQANFKQGKDVIKVQNMYFGRKK